MASRANVEAVIVKRLGVMLRAAGLDSTTVAGTNVDLNDPIGAALMQMGYPVADIALVTTAEVAAVPALKLNKFLEVVEARTLSNILQSLNDVSVFVGPKGNQLARLVAQTQSTADRML